MPDLPQWQLDYKQWVHNRKQEASFYKQYPAKASGTKQQTSSLQSQSQEDADAKKKQYVPVPKITAADQSNNKRTMKRRLTESLYLLVQRPDGRWEFPTATHSEAETIRDTADKALRAAIGGEQRVYPLGNAPAAHIQQGNGSLFFLMSQVKQDPWPLRVQREYVSDYAWVTKEELPEYLQDAEVTTTVQAML